MRKSEALTLAAQLGIIVKSANDLWDRCEKFGYVIALEHDTSDWVIFDGENEIARCK